MTCIATDGKTMAGDGQVQLYNLLDAWPRVCIGSTDEHWQVGGAIWRERMDEVCAEILPRHPAPMIHMLRGTAVANLYPFDSADSSSVGQNSHRYDMPMWGLHDERHWGAIAYANRLEAGVPQVKRTPRAKSASPIQDLLL